MAHESIMHQVAAFVCSLFLLFPFSSEIERIMCFIIIIWFFFSFVVPAAILKYCLRASFFTSNFMIDSSFRPNKCYRSAHIIFIRNRDFFWNSYRHWYENHTHFMCALVWIWIKYWNRWIYWVHFTRRRCFEPIFA